MTGPSTITFAYIISSILFIFGLKMLGRPETARRGNLVSAVGMLIAIVATLIDRQIISFQWIVIGLIAGSLIGIVAARAVKMTAMPEMVALFNGFGGAASALVALSELVVFDPALGNDLGREVFLVAAGASSLIGWVTLTGSVVAMLKLNGTLRKSLAFAGLNPLKALLAVACIALCGMLLVAPGNGLVIGALVLGSCLLGVLFVMPIGGADMPVVISFLNSLSGLAAAATGFVVGNDTLIISGSLVGAAGLILTAIMCKAMNRKFIDVMLKAYGAASASGAGEQRTVQGYEAEEAALAFDGARLVIVIPGYGMAVSQAQHVVRELAEELQRRGTEVRYAIHPVAGRMPGHMNVLLAEANVPYEQLYELDDINSAFSECDVALVVGANDTINPAAKTDPGGPLGGMPVLDVEKARMAIIVKRSLSPGYAGVDNELFYEPSTMMLFGDGKRKLSELLAAVKEL